MSRASPGVHFTKKKKNKTKQVSNFRCFIFCFFLLNFRVMPCFIFLAKPWWIISRSTALEALTGAFYYQFVVTSLCFCFYFIFPHQSCLHGFCIPLCVSRIVLIIAVFWPNCVPSLLTYELYLSMYRVQTKEPCRNPKQALHHTQKNYIYFTRLPCTLHL